MKKWICAEQEVYCGSHWGTTPRSPFKRFCCRETSWLTIDTLLALMLLGQAIPPLGYSQPMSTAGCKNQSIPTQSRIPLTGNFSSGTSHWPGWDFLRIALWFEALPTQSFLPSLLLQVLDLPHSPYMPLLLSPLSFISILPNESLIHQISSCCLLLQGFKLIHIT